MGERDRQTSLKRETEFADTNDGAVVESPDAEPLYARQTEAEHNETRLELEAIPDLPEELSALLDGIACSVEEGGLLSYAMAGRSAPSNTATAASGRSFNHRRWPPPSLTGTARVTRTAWPSTMPSAARASRSATTTRRTSVAITARSRASDSVFRNLGPGCTRTERGLVGREEVLRGTLPREIVHAVAARLDE